MKTTIEINDVLLQRAKQLAVERKLTLKAVIDAALRRFVEEIEQPPQPAPEPRKGSFRGCGLQPGLDENDFATIRAMAYEGQGE